MFSKLLIAYLINIGVFPFVAIGLFDFGVLYADPASLFAMIVLGELFLATLTLIKIAYKPERSAEKTKNSN